MKPSLVTLFFALATSVHLACATTYDVVSDFSLASNPNGVWSYGTLSSFTGGAFTPFAVASSNVNYGGQQLWWNGLSYPNAAAVDKNNSGSTASFLTIVQPTNLLRLDGENFIADVRWIAPASASYDIVGLFQRIDNQPAPVSVRVVRDAATVLFSVDGFTGFNSQQPFNLSNLFLPAGTILDFAQGAGQPNNDSTGLSLSITMVPEPSTLGLAMLLLPAVAPAVRRMRRQSDSARATPRAGTRPQFGTSASRLPAREPTARRPRPRDW